MEALGVSWSVDDILFQPFSKDGKRFVNMNISSGDKLKFQMSEDQNTNLQRITWGLTAPQNAQLDEKGDCIKFNLDLSVESTTLASFLKQLDERCEKESVAKSHEWFGKKMEERDVLNKFNKLLKTKEDGSLCVRVKVNSPSAKVPTNVWVVKGCSGNQIDYYKGTLDNLLVNSKCLVMVEASSIWFAKLFGISLNALDILVWPNEKKIGVRTLNLPDVVLKNSDGSDI